MRKWASLIEEDPIPHGSGIAEESTDVGMDWLLDYANEKAGLSKPIYLLGMSSTVPSKFVS